MTDECIAGKKKRVDFLALADIFFRSCKFTLCQSCIIVNSMIVPSYLGTSMVDIGKCTTPTFPTMVPSFWLLSLVF